MNMGDRLDITSTVRISFPNDCRLIDPTLFAFLDVVMTCLFMAFYAIQNCTF